MADAARKDAVVVSSMEDYCLEMLELAREARSEALDLLRDFTTRVDAAEALLRQRLVGLRLSQDSELSEIIDRVDAKFDQGKLRPVVLTTHH